MYERRSGNRWYKAKGDKEPNLTVNQERISVLKRHEPFTYLGKPLTVAGETENQVPDMLKDYTEILDQIGKSHLSLALKLEALECMAMASIQHYFANTYIDEDHLHKFDKVLTAFLRKSFSIYTNTTVRTMFQKKKSGGIGVRKPSRVYRSVRISHLVNMLNHENENIRFVARNSLQLDMKKRGVNGTTDDENFLGFACANTGKLKTNIKGGFGVQSDWPQLCYLIHRAGTTLKWEHSEKIDLMQAGNAQLIYKCEKTNVTQIITGKQIRTDLVEKLMYDDLIDLKNLPMQGRLIDIRGADYLLSQSVFRNYKLSENLVTFWYKARHNVMPCNYTLSLWYPEQSAACQLDNYHLESMSHILNGCKQLQKNYTKRHDRILEKVADELKITGKSIFVNKTARTTFKQLLNTEFKDQETLDLKPDLVIKNEDKSMTIIDIACPYDLYIENTYQDKIENTFL